MSEVKVPEGYKQTEIGVIPQDWEVKELGSQSLKIGSGSDSKDKNGTYPLYGSTGIIGKSKFFSYDQQSILVARVGANAGFVNLVNGKYGVSDNTIVIDLNNSNDVEFIKSWLIKKDLNTLVFGSGQPLITGTQLKKLLIALPSKKEQTTIATALSNVDNLIQSLEKLIAKKEAIKTGTMQQLLTGKTRLPEFATREDDSLKGFKQTELGRIPEDWEVVEFGEIVNSTQLGGNYANSIKPTDFPLIKMGNIDRGQIKLDKQEYITGSAQNKDLLKYSDLLFNTRNTLELVGKVAIWRNELPVAYFNSNLMRISFLESLISNNFFINYLMNSKYFIGQLSEIAIGTTSVAAIYSKDLFKIKLSLPYRQEQTAIATILSDMDTEIQALQQRLEKTKDIKQGMMQQLLTGKVRLAH